jgi:oxazoline/thiazoline synthase
MIERPRFRQNLTMRIAPPDKVLLMSESGYFSLDGRTAALIAPLIDGKRTAHEIVDAVANQVSMTQAYYVMAFLENRGYIEQEVDDLPAGAAGFWNSVGVSAAAASQALATSPVSLVCIGDVAEAEFAASLTAIGVQISDRALDAPRTVVLVDDYLQPAVGDLNLAAIKTGQPWMIVKPNGILSWIGPIFAPGESACWDCLGQRIAANRDVESFAQLVTGSAAPYPARPMLATTIDTALSMAATEVAMWVVTNKDERWRDNLVTINHTTLEMRKHSIVRRPQCPSCGDPTLQASVPRPITFGSSKKEFLSDGGHRTVTPQQTLQRLEHHVSPITGIVNELVRVTDAADRLQHVYVSGANLAARNYSYRNLKRTLRSKSCGKGVTDEQARASAIGEAIERYSGTFRGDEARLTGTYRELGDRAVDPRRVMQFSERQYAEREIWNARDSLFNNVPLPFDDNASMEWSPIWSMTDQCLKYLPTAYCYYSYPVTPEEHFVLPDSNGAAAGNTREEAMIQGFLELVERDSVALWWYSMASRPAVNLETFKNSFAVQLRDYHRSIGRELWVLDLTADLGIPAVVALSGKLHADRQEIIFAPAAHLDPEIALLRALTELNQMLPGVLEVDEAGEYRYNDRECVEWWRHATVENQPYLLPSSAPATKASDFPCSWSDDIGDDLKRCQSLVEDLGLEMLIHDQTRPDTGLPVLKVIVPGLRHFWARFATGRLYDIPPQLGWIDKRLEEHELNPIPIFI